MDEATQRLIERTRQRREILIEKLGKTPDPAPRKRAIPLADNTYTNNIHDDDESPKRHCVRESEQSVKCDTPAIAGVKSRLVKLKENREVWSDVSDGDISMPVATPRKSLSSPPLERRAPPIENDTGTRGNRFAKLAYNINSWEDDLNHPTIVSKDEEKKPKWQPPKSVSSDNTLHKGLAPEPPKQKHFVPPSTKKTHAPPPPPPLPSTVNTCKSLPVKTNVPVLAPKASPVKPSPKVSYTMSSPLRTPQQSDNGSMPVNAKGLNETPPSDQTDDEPTAKPVSDRFAKWEQKTNTTPKVDDPTQTPVSARMANWQQKASNNLKSTPVSSASKFKPFPKLNSSPTVPPKPNLVANTVGNMTVHKTTADDPASLPVSSRMATWQKKAAQPKSDDEPTAYPVMARMSAWEEMSSTNQVSYIKKVNPARSPAHAKPTQPIALGAIVTSSSKLAQRGADSPKHKTLTPSKSFVESIQERASQINSPNTDLAKKAFSPATVSCTMKSVQQRLIEQTHNSDKSTNLVDKIRGERMAELDAIKNRWKNGILNDEAGDEIPPSEQGIPPPPPIPESLTNSVTSNTNPGKMNNRDAIRAKARADFDQKLSAMGFEVPEGPDSPVATFHFKRGQSGQTPSSSSEENKNQDTRPPRPPTTVTNKPPPSPTLPTKQSGRPNSIYGLISKTKAEPAPVNTRQKFDDSFDSDNEDQIDKSRKCPPQFETTDTDPTTESEDDLVAESSAESDYAPPPVRQPVMEYYDDGDDDVSLSAFVPASVRRESILPHGEASNRRSVTSETSYDSFDNTNDYNKYIKQQSKMAVKGVSSMTSSTSQSSLDSRDQTYLDETHDEDDQTGINDLLDEAMDSDDSEQPVAAPRKRHEVLEEPTSPLIYSVSMYRSKRYSEHPPPAKMKIVRNSNYTEMGVQEEDIRMPEHPPAPTSHKSLKERIQELQELVQQEQNIIMQTSNALNQCCSGNSAFAGSSEQVECNRLLLISCQKRQAYLTEVQRIRATGRLEECNGGPKGSLTISDIRLPLKKEFVTKIGTTQDTTTYYFLLLIHNGSQLIFTQMLSTHDPMMRGSLDFPNLIKINGIGGDFNLNIEIFGMSISKELIGKDKKKKTPKKSKSGLHLQSPGGPLAVRTTSFSLITSFNITMGCLDKSSFSLERLPYLSPLHGTIFMRLKCLIEASVEERGFLTMFEDVSGLGAWHRRWIVLSSNKLCFWKYPDDESRKDPIGFIDLKRCTTEKVGLIPRDICARPNTFELVTVRQPRRGEQDTLITKTYNTMTTVKVMLSADTKEERIVWCNKVNRALVNIRTWHSDAMRPVKTNR